jgi:hypothetical protein
VVPAGDGALADAVAAQERAPDDVAAAPSPGAWTWLLDGTALPRPGALGELADALARVRPIVAPALLASRVVGADGALAPAHVPLAPQGEVEVAMRTVPQRVLHVRAVTGASVLLPPGTPVGDGAALVWTARLLRDAPGFLVPASVADARDGVAPRAPLALLTGDALRPRERLRMAAGLLERVSAGRRRAPRGRP